MRSVRPAICLGWMLACFPAVASADWHLTPFLGAAFGGNTTLVDLQQAAGQSRPTYGGAVTWLGPGVLGFEIDFGYTPGFFERGTEPRLVISSHVATLMPNLVIAAPLRWTGYSLRPYFSGGAGLMRTRIDDLAGIFPVSSNLLATNLGGGLVGFLTDRTGVRWDLRYFRNIRRDDEGDGISFGPAHLSYWRGSIGFIIRY
jgi:hypothetical protein